MKAFFRLKQLNPRDNAILTIKLFDFLVVPILTYACEICGSFALRKVDKQDFRTLCNPVHCEKLHIRWCNYLLGVGKRATILPSWLNWADFQSHSVIEHSLNYWHCLCCLPEFCLVKQLYLDTLSQESDNNLRRFWSGCVHQILHKFDSNLDWGNQSMVSSSFMKTILISYANADIEIAKCVCVCKKMFWKETINQCWETNHCCLSEVIWHLTLWSTLVN